MLVEELGEHLFVRVINDSGYANDVRNVGRRKNLSQLRGPICHQDDALELLGNINLLEDDFKALTCERLAHSVMILE